MMKLTLTSVAIAAFSATQAIAITTGGCTENPDIFDRGIVVTTADCWQDIVHDECKPPNIRA